MKRIVILCALLSLSILGSAQVNFEPAVRKNTVAQRANNVRKADAFGSTSSNAGARIAAAIADLPSTGGKVDACGLEGAQAWTSNIFSGITKTFTLELCGSTTTISANTTVPSNITLQLNPGAILSVNSGITLTINSPIEASRRQIFAGTGSVVLSVQPEIYPEWFAGSDIGAQINNAYAAAPVRGAKISILPQTTCYNFSTPIVLDTADKAVILAGTASPGYQNDTNQGGTCLNYTPTTSTTAITMDWMPTGGNGYFATGAGIRDLALVNNGSCETQGGCASSATGILIGSTGTNGGIGYGRFDNVKIQGFGIGILNTAGGISFGNLFTNVSFKSNTVGYRGESAQESVLFVGGVMDASETGFQMVAPNNLKIWGMSFDNNTVHAIHFDSSTGGSNVQLDGVHFENCCPALDSAAHNSKYIRMEAGVNLTLNGGVMADDCADAADCNGVTDTEWIYNLGATFISGLGIGTAGRLPSAAIVNGFGTWTFGNDGSIPPALACTDPRSTTCTFVDNTDPQSSVLQTPAVGLAPASGAGVLKLTAKASSGNTTLSFPAGADGGEILTNVNLATGIQRFSTTTTCTTAAAVGAKCQTAAISLPVAFSDTTYVVLCALRGTTNAGALQEVENTSSSTFKLTIVAADAATFSYTVAGCMAYHL